MKPLEEKVPGKHRLHQRGYPNAFVVCGAMLMVLVLVVIAPRIWIARPVFAASESAAQPGYFREGVCPPIHLRDEEGQIINPVRDVLADRPYSPKKTCGQCHDYEKITEGYHFTQGAGERATPDQAERCLWASTPGNYGGTWCSPAPLYRYLSPKNNETARTMDMTSFSFLTSGCAACHPGGGSAEYDREGQRYDQRMADSANGLRPSGENGLDGDYYQARWSESGVLEADCLLCHLPEYNFAARKKQLEALNFRWAPTVGAGLGKVTGSVQEGTPVNVSYDVSLFNEDGTLSPHIVREPRNETCLACHAKPGWKKRGANFRGRTDVHLRAGLKCVDCHPSGNQAVDERVRGKEVHQFGKGDDPGGHVRDDLDNTCRDCADCHSIGTLGAPIAKHRWLPPLHLETIACQTCHIPERTVKAARVVASDVFNPGAKIPSKGKHLWTFYGPDMAYWNHYGDLEMMGYDDKPTDAYRPTLVRYKNKIYPVNRVHSTWPAIEVEGAQGLMQPKMGDIYTMWNAHQTDPARYAALAVIEDDNGDGVEEVNRPEEIDALIQSVTEMLRGTDYPMDGKRVVWVSNQRVYSAGTEYREIAKHSWEASPYANVHKYTHDVYPAKAALGSSGCTDCHHPSADFFFARVVKRPLDERGKPVTEPQYHVLGLTTLEVTMSTWREAYLKPFTYGVLIFLGICSSVLLGQAALKWLMKPQSAPRWLRSAPVILGVSCGAAILLSRQETVMEPMLPSRFWLDSNHFLVAALIMALGGLAVLWELRPDPLGSSLRRRFLTRPAAMVLGAGLLLASTTGALMFLRLDSLGLLTKLSYTGFDMSLTFIVLCVVVVLSREIVLELSERKEQLE